MEGERRLDSHTEEAVVAVTELQRTFLLTALGVSSLIFGSKVCPEDFTRCVMKPKALCMSIVISVLVSPLLAYVLTLVMHLDVADGITLMVTCCCPAGNLSPIFAYYTKSDVCLCLAVIVMSTLMSVGMIPLGMYLCSSAYTELDLTVIPDRLIVANLFLSMGGISIGMAFRKYKERWADRFVKAFSCTPMLVIFIMIIIVGVKLPHSLQASAAEVFAILLYLTIVLPGAYVTGRLIGQDHDTCRSMAFCSANKNVMLALTIVHVSFAGEVLVETLPVPTLFLIQYILIGLLLSAIYEIYNYYNFSALSELLESLKPGGASV